MHYDKIHEDPYVDANGTLKNLAGITDTALLQKEEALQVFARQSELWEKPIPGHYDAQHVRAVHRHLFQDVFAWAGEFRTVGLSKGDSMFCVPAFIESQLNRIGADLVREDFLRGLVPIQFSERAAYFLDEWNAIHPFREGNGRTQRALLTQLARACGFDLRWAKVTRAEITEASIASAHRADNSHFAALLLREIAG
ncbi:MAG: Fic family protein [Puniceicoccales bacterium]|nr:Fic family protein [Puniceicoccales bacterium]